VSGIAALPRTLVFFFALPALWIGLRIVLLASAEIEVRQLFELEDFGPSEAMKRFRDMGVARKK
jgi:hypothetical protein